MITIPSGTNFTSNGQRNATAEIRLDGALISAPEQGEGGNSNVYYEPLVEGMQEMKVQNNSFSAEFGNNGGTVVNMVMKSGTDQFPRQWLVFPAARAVGRSRLLQSRSQIPNPTASAIRADSRWAARSSRTELSSLSISKKFEAPARQAEL